MSLLFLLGFVLVCWLLLTLSDSEDGSDLLILATLFLLVPIALSLYGSYSWLHDGYWETIRVGDVLFFLSNKGINTEIFFSISSWGGIQKIHMFYLESSIGWTSVIGGLVGNILSENVRLKKITPKSF